MSAQLKEFGPPAASGTADLCEIMDKFFDCVNVRSDFEHLKTGWQKTGQRGSAAGRKWAIVARSATLPLKKFWKEISKKLRKAQFQ